MKKIAIIFVITIVLVIILTGCEEWDYYYESVLNSPFSSPVIEKVEPTPKPIKVCIPTINCEDGYCEVEMCD